METSSLDKTQHTTFIDFATLLRDEYCTHIRLYDVDAVFDYARVVCIVNARSLTHMAGITDKLPILLEQTGQKQYVQYCLKRAQAKRMGEWVIHDLKDIIVHLFMPRAREYYNLDSVFFQAPILYSHE